MSPYKDLETRRPAETARRQRIRAAVAEIRRKTTCIRCGKQPIDWHREEHVAQPHLRISRMVSIPRPLSAILAEIARCTPLCRRCHFLEDGRMVALVARNKQRGPQPKKPCTECLVPSKPLRHGLCDRCRQKARRAR